MHLLVFPMKIFPPCSIYIQMQSQRNITSALLCPPVSNLFLLSRARPQNFSSLTMTINCTMLPRLKRPTTQQSLLKSSGICVKIPGFLLSLIATNQPKNMGPRYRFIQLLTSRQWFLSTSMPLLHNLNKIKKFAHVLDRKEN